MKAVQYIAKSNILLIDYNITFIDEMTRVNTTRSQSTEHSVPGDGITKNISIQSSEFSTIK